MKNKIIIFGNGEIAELAYYYFSNFTSFEVIGFSIDQNFIKEDTFCKKPILPFENIETIYNSSDVLFHVALSYKKLNQIRAKKFQDVKSKGFNLASFVSEKSNFDKNAFQYGENCFILENQTIQKNVKIGNNVMIWSSNHIGHGSLVGDHTYISSQVVISGHCKIGKRCFFGVNSSTADFINVENDVFVGMGATVASNVKSGSVVLNNKSKIYDKDDRISEIIKKKYFKF